MRSSAQVRTRFAPSPTGDLHVGSVRTALYSYLYARRHQGTFILRIEDTDLERSTDASTEIILKGMEWLGLNADEGPFYQSKRTALYQEVLQRLLSEKKAYYCRCSKERLQELREQQLAHKQKPRYDGHCRDLNLPFEPDYPAVIRFRNPQQGEVFFEDQVYGPIRFQNEELDDLIIARSDGSPTYNFTVVVDDWDMKITHVIRGDDHINNTPRQINIFHALETPPPVYAHLPMILGADGKKYSKRHGAASVLQFKEQGYLAEALLNYLVRLGWSSGNQEIFSQDEMIKLFDLQGVNKSAAAFDMEKLNWLNQHYLKTLSPHSIAPRLAEQLEHQGISVNAFSDSSLEAIIPLQVERSKTLVEMAEKSMFFFKEIDTYDAKAVTKNISKEILPVLSILIEKLNQLELDEWKSETLHSILHGIAEQHEVGLGKIAQPIRIALTGGTISPPIDATLEVLGKAKTISRLQHALKLWAENF